MARSSSGRPPGTSDARQRLIDACWTLLTDPAGRAPTVAAVCALAGCTPPTLYHHFGDVHGLRTATCSAAFARWATELESQVATSSDPRERLNRRGEAYVRWGIAHPAAYRVLFLESHDGDGSDEPGSGFVDLMRDLAELTGLAHDSPRLMAVALAHWSAVHGLTCIAITNPKLPEPVVWSAFEALTDALRTLVTA